MSSPSPRRVHLELESLETRCVLSSASYVGALYTDLLHRSGSQSEISGFVTLLDSGTSPAQVTTDITTSPEFLSNLVQSDYQIYLRRAASSQEVQGWVMQLQHGLGEQQLQATIIGSGEFFALHGSDNSRFVNAVYKEVLGRPAAASESGPLVGLLNSGTSRVSVALAIVTSTEADARLVTAAYEEVLGRAPDAAGLAGFVNQLQNGLTPSQLLSELASSPEFINDQGGLDANANPNPPPPPPPVYTYVEPGLYPYGYPYGYGGYGYGYPYGYSGSGFSGCGCSGSGFGGSGSGSGF